MIDSFSIQQRQQRQAWLQGSIISKYFFSVYKLSFLMTFLETGLMLEFYYVQNYVIPFLFKKLRRFVS